MDHHCHFPKFKSIPPPSLPLSSPLISPSSYLAFSELLDSPVLFSNSNLVASPTTGAFSGEEFNKWSNYGHGISEVSDFTFQLPRAVSQSSSPHEPWKRQQEDKNKKTKVKSEFDHSSCQLFHASQIIQETKNKSSSDDGYKWRKYGQKQAKGSENPRSYYKCTYPSCPTKKKVETSPEDGHVTEIVYKGEHNHPKPTTNNYKPYNNNSSNAPQHNSATSQLSNSDLSATSTRRIDSETSVSTGEGGGCGDDLEGMSSRWNGSETQTLYPKKRKGGYGDDNRRPSPTISENRTVRKPRVVVQTLSEMDILDDGYKWRKYGQKVVKGNPNPRSYYKCTSTGCPVRKHVERAAQDTRAVITTYEGRHNHDLPVARGGGGGGAPIKPPPIRPTAIPRTMTTSADHQGVFEYRPEEKFQQTNSSFVLSGFQENRDSIMSRTKDEPADNSVFASFLSY